MSLWSVGNNSSSYNNYGFSGLTNLLGEYSSIKSGSYKKLMDQYYRENPVENSNNSTNKTKETDSKEDLLKIRGEADDLKKAASALTTRGKKSLFEKVTIKTTDKETGVETETLDYDRDAISKAVNAFVKGYNSLVDTIGDLNSESLLRKGVAITSSTKATSNLLAKAGISIGTDNKLTIDEDKLKSADINVLKTLFNGSNSLADKVSTRAQQISNEAVKAQNPGKLYGVNGKYSNYSSGNYYNALL